jgi:putative membrane protein
MLKNFAFGAIFGIANIIPGVSGGTVAFLLGFYERLIQAITRLNKSFFLDSIALLKSPKNFKSYLKRYDLVFLAQLGCGAFLAIVSLSKLMHYLLIEHREPTYGFFLGLVLCSIWMPVQHIKSFRIPHLVFLGVFAIGTASLNFIESPEDKINRAEQKALIKKSDSSSFQTPRAELLPYVLAGSIAASAMILPGISGSFMLVLMGVYFDILTAIAQRNFAILFCVAFGCMIGLLLFTRLLKFLLQHYSDLTMSSMLGLMLGSLVALWPFREIQIVASQRVETHYLLAVDTITTLSTIVFFVIGFFIVLGFYFANPKPTDS